MAASTQWEVVGKSSKKGKAQGQGSAKSQIKTFLENAPKIEIADPVKESPTIYTAFLEKERKEAQRMEQTPNGRDHMKTSADTGGARSKVKEPIGAKKKGTFEKKVILPLEEAVQRLDASELETVLLKAKSMFRENPDLWLKDLASMLNLRLDCVEELDPLFEGKPIDYPCSLLSAQVHKVLLSTVKECSDGVLTVFLEHCFTFMINDMAKNVPAHGYRIFIQLLCIEKPHIALQNIDKYIEMINTHQNRPLRCMSIMWGIGQAGLKDLNSGLQVWFQMMFPLLKIRALSFYAVDYLDRLFKLYGDQKTDNGVVTLRNFFQILDMAHLTRSNLNSTHHKKLRALYPQIKEIAFGSNPENRLRQFFPSFLARLTTSCTDNLRKELEECLVYCLSVDKHCFSTWMQMYTKHIPHSSLLLEYILAKWETVHPKFDPKVLRETIRAFSITNEELSAPGKQPGEGLNICTAVCKELLLKMSRWQFPWGLFFLTLFGILTTLIAYDVSTHGGFKRSRTAQMLENAGVLVYMEQAWNRIHLYLGKALQ